MVYLAMVLFIPFTKVSVPAVGLYELTMGDLLLLICTGLIIYTKTGIRSSFVPFYAILMLFVFTSFSSIVMVRDWNRFFLSMVPFAFSLLISFVTLSFFSTGNLKNRFYAFRNLLIFSLTISAIPVYLQLFFGFKNILFYDRFGWRYTFLSQNPNQYGVYFILFFFLMTLITIKFYPNKLGRLLLFQFFFFIPAFFSGSRSTTLVFAMNYAFLLFFYFRHSGMMKRTFIIVAVVLVGVFAAKPAIDLAKTRGGQITRALDIFERVADYQEFEIAGPTGSSQDAAVDLFFKYPILGVGLGNKGIYTGNFLEIHNTFYLFLAETGIIGFIVFLLMFSITPLYAIFSRSKLDFILLIIVFYTLFAALNVPAMLFRQRWVWLFLCISFILVNVDNDGNIQRSKLKLFN